MWSCDRLIGSHYPWPQPCSLAKSPPCRKNHTTHGAEIANGCHPAFQEATTVALYRLGHASANRIKRIRNRVRDVGVERQVHMRIDEPRERGSREPHDLLVPIGGCCVLGPHPVDQSVSDADRGAGHGARGIERRNNLIGCHKSRRRRCRCCHSSPRSNPDANGCSAIPGLARCGAATC
ncbi:hypothetical protein SMALB_0248 [Streptomyces malaysiensis]|uniref:Uncharacterized protein n=1 Tax=Streptomyces malaysiensis TaxID=92644 RepID=A0A7X5WWK5_STRMQ|nr:hypothetical protein [Streptomyces malaysiensis]